MDFIRLNRKKIFIIFILCITIWALFWYFIFFTSQHNIIGGLTDSKSIKILIILISSFSFFTFAIYFFAGLQNFYKARYLLRKILSINIFDNDYNIELTHRKSSIFYTRECAFGTIHDYPAIIRVYLTIGKHPIKVIQFYFYIIKFNKIKIESLSITLDNNDIPENIKQIAFEYVENIIKIGYKKGNVVSGEEAADMII